MALGAVPRDVTWMVMREVLLLVVCGRRSGCFLSLAFGSLVRSQLYGLEAHDPFTLVSVVAAFRWRPGWREPYQRCAPAASIPRRHCA